MFTISLPKRPAAPRSGERAAEGGAPARLLPSLPPGLTLGQGVVAAMALFLVALTAVYSLPVFDLWWQLKAGQWIVQTRSIPSTDPFSFTAQGQPWVLQEWLTELLFYGLYTALPAVALVWFKVIGITLAFGLVFWRAWLRSGHFLLSLSVTVLATYGAQPFFDMRPQVLSYVFLSVLLLILEGRRAGRWPRAVWAVPGLMLLWANCHAGFILGLIVLAVELASEGAEKLAAGHLRAPGLSTLACVTGLSALVVLLNPAGPGAYVYPFTLTEHSGMLDMVVEWRSPNFHKAFVRPYEWLLLLAVGAIAFSRGRRVPADLGLLIALVHASLFSFRHVPVFTLVAAPIAAQQFAAALAEAMAWLQGRRSARARRASASTPRRGPAAAALGVAAAALFFGILHEWQRIPAGNWFNYCAQMDAFPSRACDFLLRQNWSPRLLNRYAWGGYCVWRLYPKYQVFIDNRAEVFFNSSFDDYTRLRSCSPGWKELLDKWQIDTVLMPSTEMIAQMLAHEPGWTLAYQDKQAVIFHRLAAPGAEAQRDTQLGARG